MIIGDAAFFVAVVAVDDDDDGLPCLPGCPLICYESMRFWVFSVTWQKQKNLLMIWMNAWPWGLMAASRGCDHHSGEEVVVVILGVLRNYWTWATKVLFETFCGAHNRRHGQKRLKGLCR